MYEYGNWEQGRELILGINNLNLLCSVSAQKKHCGADWTFLPVGAFKSFFLSNLTQNPELQLKNVLYLHTGTVWYGGLKAGNAWTGGVSFSSSSRPGRSWGERGMRVPLNSHGEEGRITGHRAIFNPNCPDQVLIIRVSWGLDILAFIITSNSLTKFIFSIQRIRIRDL